MLYHIHSPYYRQFLTSVIGKVKAPKAVAATTPAAPADEASKTESAAEAK